MHANTPEFLQVYRCPGCDKLLFKGILVISTVQVKCKKCGTLATFSQLDSNMHEDQFTLLADNTGRVVATGPYKKAFCGPQQSLVGTQLFALLLLMGHEEQYKKIMETLEASDHTKTYSLIANTTDSPLALRWSFLLRGDIVYLYVLFNKDIDSITTSKTEAIQKITGVIPDIIQTTDAALVN